MYTLINIYKENTGQTDADIIDIEFDDGYVPEMKSRRASWGENRYAASLLYLLYDILYI